MTAVLTMFQLQVATAITNMKGAISNTLASVEPSGVISTMEMYTLSAVQDVLDKVDEIVEGVIDIFTTLFSDDGIISIFYDDSDGLTFIGALLLIVFGFGLVRWGFNWVKKLISLRG